jgi:hypothetical protein
MSAITLQVNSRPTDPDWRADQFGAPRRYAIVTASDLHCGEFLLTHWLTSIEANVRLGQIDIVVLDYGLTAEQRRELRARGVVVYPCVKDGFVGNLRYRDIVRLCDERGYEQVMSVDASDVIFQADCSGLFDIEPTYFRAVAEGIRTPFFESFIDRSDVHPVCDAEILRDLRWSPQINSGMVIGPASSFREFWEYYLGACHSFNCYGVDQYIFNHYAYSRDTVRLVDERYNFIPVSSKQHYRIVKGTFVDRRGELFPIVHNAGGKTWMRAIARFGYGPTRNRWKWFLSMILHIGVGYLRLRSHAAYLLQRLRRKTGPIRELPMASGDCSVSQRS